MITTKTKTMTMMTTTTTTMTMMMTTTMKMMTKEMLRAVAQDELNAADSEKITGIGILTFIRLILIDIQCQCGLFSVIV